MTAPVAPWTGIGNDYRGVLELEPGPHPSIAVIVTLPEALAAVDAFGAPPAGEVEVVLVGSDEVLDASLRRDGWRVVTVVAAGNGATLRNAGAAATGCDVVLFVGEPPSGSLSGLLDRHLAWHRRAGNLVVIESTGAATEPPRRRTERRTRRFLVGDMAHAAMPVSGMSVRRDRFLDAGGFVPGVEAPDGTDPVLGWRLWNDGAFLVPDVDPAEVGPDRTTAAARSDDPAPLVADLVPHRTVRPVASPLATVPKASWVAAVADRDEADRVWRACSTGVFADVEVIMHGPEAAVGHLAGLAGANPALTVIGSEDAAGFAAAVAAARGELVALLDGRIRPDPALLARAVARLDGEPGTATLRHGYRIGGDRYRRLDDLLAVDAAVGRHGLPLFGVVRRRELMKQPALLADPHAAWAAALERGLPALVITALVDLDEPTVPGALPPPRRPGLTEVSALAMRDVVRSAVRRDRADRGAAPGTEPGEAPGDDRIVVAYVGFIGHDNLGDEAVMAAIQGLMPWAALERDPVDPKLVLVGGGTLINGRRYYLTRLRRNETPVVERALFGTGVRSPEYWGVTEPMEDWFTFMDTALVAAVRGPDSVRNLRTLGYHRDLPVIGDPALSLRTPAGTERVAGRIVVCPVYTSGNLHGGDDGVVFDALAATIARYRAEGREVVMLSAFPQDDRWVIDLMRRAGAAEMPYLAGYADLDETMRLLGSADLVIGERLHASIMAAAAGTPFVGLEYRPKVRDFARSVGQEDAVIRTDQMDRLDTTADRVLATGDEVAAAIAVEVNRYRTLQEQAADELHRRLTGAGVLAPPTGR